jgi:uncharacterized protein
MPYMLNKIILGTAQFGMNYGIANKKGKIKLSEIFKILNFLKKKKINILDTANSYKSSESEIGRYFFKTKNKFKIITKYSFKNSNTLSKQFKKTFSSLGYLPDTIIAHSCEDYLNPLFHKEVKIIKNKYFIKKLGVSIYNVEELNKVLDYKKPDVIQVPINIFDKRFFDKKIIKILKKRSVKIIGRSVFLQGLLFKDKEYILKNFKNIKKEYFQLLKIAKSEKVSLSQLSLIWAFNLKELDKIVIGVDSLDHLRENLDTLKKKISKKSLLQIQKINLNNNKIIIPYLWKIKQ